VIWAAVYAIIIDTVDVIIVDTAIDTAIVVVIVCAWDLSMHVNFLQLFLAALDYILCS
jgi:hypothetical protein